MRPLDLFFDAPTAYHAFKRNVRHKGAGTATNGSQKWDRHTISRLETMCRGFLTNQTATANRISEK